MVEKKEKKEETYELTLREFHAYLRRESNRGDGFFDIPKPVASHFDLRCDNSIVCDLIIKSEKTKEVREVKESVLAVYSTGGSEYYSRGIIPEGTWGFLELKSGDLALVKIKKIHKD